LHKEGTPSFMVDPEKQLWHCHGCGAGGSVIDLHAALQHITIGEAIRELSPDKGRGSSQPAPAAVNEPARREIAAYDYHDATGSIRFQVVRYEPKDFRQCRIADDGKRIWNMDRVERLPNRLPELLASCAEHIWIVEGAKDADALRAAGETATCNPGGAGKWLPAFGEYLRDKCVHICPDRDEAGQKHGKQVLKSLEGICRWARWVELPPEWNGVPVKDIADFSEACGAAFLPELAKLQTRSPLIERAIEGNAFTALELEDQYIAEKKRFHDVTLGLANWLPGLNLRPLGSGDVLGIVAGTGQLQTAVAQNILAANPKLEALFFQLELSGRSCSNAPRQSPPASKPGKLKSVTFAGKALNGRRAANLKSFWSARRA
jgi:CHC2 zinc finger